MRAFVAIPVPKPLENDLEMARQKLVQTRADVRWLPPAQFHITLKFLADLPDTLLEETQRRLTACAAQVPVFPLELEGFDRFPERGPARAIIVRVVSPDQRIMRLHRLIDTALAGIGLPLDTRVLVPHLTLGRARSNHGMNRLLRLLEKHAFDALGTLQVDKIILIRSDLSSDGPTHTPLHEAFLAQYAPNAPIS